MTNGRIFGMNSLALIMLSHNTLGLYACCNLQQAYNPNSLSIRYLTATNLVPRILDKEVVGRKFSRRYRKDQLVGRERLSCKRISSLVRPEIV